jgi:hypothetical protein
MNIKCLRYIITSPWQCDGHRSAAIPTGLQVDQGPDAVVQFLKGRIDEIMA